MLVKIKICGITRYEDARIAAHLGADALGFIFYPKSPRFIAPAAAREIIRQLPPFITKVGVFVNESTASILDIVATAGINALQLHGNETPEMCQSFPLPVIKAFSVAQYSNLAPLPDYKVAGYLLDTWDEKLKGGTGKTFDWTLAQQAARTIDTIILAGGLGPTNLLEAIERVMPYGVDVNSGVEISPGVKNPKKMRDVIEIVKSWK